MKKIFIALAAAAAVFVGCNRETVGNGGKGSLEFMIASVDDTWNDRQEGMTGRESSVPGTKAYDKDEVLNSLLVTISNRNGVGEPKQWIYSEMPAVLELTEGQYSISAVSPESGIAAWDKPAFSGQQDFSIVAGRTSTVELVCSLTNVKVTVKCTEAFKAEFTDYSITVKSKAATSEDGFLVWGMSEVEEGREGFFAVSDMEVNVSAYRWSDATQQKDPVEAVLLVKDVAARDHIVLNIDAQATGAADLDGEGADESFIIIDDGTNDRTENIFIGGLEDIPVPGDGGGVQPEKPEAPSLVWAANPSFEPMEITSGMDVNLVIKAPGKISGFVIGVSSSVLESIVGTSMDLINDEELIGMFGSMFPTGDALLGHTEVDFSLSSLVPLILGLSPEPGSEHTFTLNVEDGYGQTLNQSLTFIVPGQEA